MYKYLVYFSLISFTLVTNLSFSQDLDVDELLEKIERLESNVSDLQKGKFDKLDKSLSSGYISRNEERLDNFETKTRANFGLIEEIDNKIRELEEKFNILNQEYQSEISKLQKKIKSLKSDKISKTNNEVFENNKVEKNEVDAKKKNISSEKNFTESEIKKNMKTL